MPRLGLPRFQTWRYVRVAFGQCWYQLSNKTFNYTKNIFTIDIPGHFERNGFLMDTSVIRLKFYAKVDVSESSLTEALTIRSYKNSLV